MVSRAERTEDLAKNLKIFVSEAHIFTSDAIVLADFCAPRHKDKCCDLGTGNGIIPLLWLRDFKPKEITGVELSDSAVNLLNKTLTENNIEDKIKVIHHDLRTLKGVLPNEYYDIVSINPPYKKLGTGIVNTETDYQNARHEFTCTLDDCCYNITALKVNVVKVIFLTFIVFNPLVKTACLTCNRVNSKETVTTVDSESLCNRTQLMCGIKLTVTHHKVKESAVNILSTK